MDNPEKIEEELKKIRDEIIKCQKCSLYRTRNYPVVGQGNHQAKIMFVGEAPGAWEDKTGCPFCGSAGKILDELLNSVGIKREDVYIANLLKDRPPRNRDPEKEEIEACVPYLERQIKIIKPEIICSLGRYSMEFLMKKFGLEHFLDSIGGIHGKIFEVKSFPYSLKIIPLYHPAAAIYNPAMKEILRKDFQILKNI